LRGQWLRTRVKPTLFDVASGNDMQALLRASGLPVNHALEV
jgi:hypothetical protein